MWIVVPQFYLCDNECVTQYRVASTTTLTQGGLVTHRKMFPDSTPPLARRETHLEMLHRRRTYKLETRVAIRDNLPSDSKPIVFTHITNQPRKG